MSRGWSWSLIFLAATMPMASGAEGDFLPAFPGAVGQGAAATGGRGGDVYHVTNLEDYDHHKGQEKIPGSFRHALRSAEGPRTIVFDVGGPIALAGPLEILKDDITIAGQTSPTSITLWGYPVEVSKSSNIVIRYLRFRLGDFHARRPGAVSTSSSSPLNRDLDPTKGNAGYVGNGCDRVILDHVSVSWGMDETLSVTKCRNVTIQNSIIAESLNDSYHPKGRHGYGSLLRGVLTPEDQKAGVGGYTMYGNLWASNRGRNPSLGGHQSLEKGKTEAERLRTDVNLVNNVIYNWGDRPTHRSELGEVRVNLVGNYYVNGPSSKEPFIFHEDNTGRTFVYHQGNMHDRNQDKQLDGELIDSAEEVAVAFRGFGPSSQLMGPNDGQPFGFGEAVVGAALSAQQAYEQVLRSAGSSLVRDAVDERVIDSVVNRTGHMVDSQEEFRDADGNLPGIDDLPRGERPAGFDTDGDGMPNAFEQSHGLDPHDPSDGNGKDLSDAGYTNLEVYLNGLVESEDSH